MKRWNTISVGMNTFSLKVIHLKSAYRVAPAVPCDVVRVCGGGGAHLTPDDKFGKVVAIRFPSASPQGHEDVIADRYLNQLRGLRRQMAPRRGFGCSLRHDFVQLFHPQF